MAQALHAPAPTEILLAVAPDVVPRMTRILSGHQIRTVSSIAEAQKALAAPRPQFGLVVLGVTFDESQMFELLAHVRSLERYKATPVLCVLGAASRITQVSVEAIDRAAKAMLANAFLWLVKFPDDEQGNARIRRIADYLILIDGDMHHGVHST